MIVYKSHLNIRSFYCLPKSTENSHFNIIPQISTSPELSPCDRFETTTPELHLKPLSNCHKDNKTRVVIIRWVGPLD